MMRGFVLVSLALCTALAALPWSGGQQTPGAGPQEDTSRTHSSGRELPPMPESKQPVMFNTPEADRILAALQVFPADNPWNEDISKLPLHPNSKNLIASVGANKGLAFNSDMGF